MKKLIVILLFLIACFVNAQDTSPLPSITVKKLISPNNPILYYNTADSALWVFKGETGWLRLATHQQLLKYYWTKNETKNYADGKVSDAAYDSNWNGVTTIAPSKNSIYDKIETLVPVTYCPTTMTVNTGTLLQGTVSDLCAVGGTDVIIQEATGADPLRVTFTFNPVQRLTSFSFYGRYAGGAAHVTYIEAYNYTIATWQLIGELGNTADKQWQSYNIFLPNNFISTGVVQVRFNHQGNGINTHQLILDYVDVNYGGAGGSSFETASEIAFIPNGNISSTNVQAAIQELDSEKEPVFSKGELTSSTPSITITNGMSRLVAGTASIGVTSGYIIPTTASATTWDIAYNRSPVGLSVTGTDTRTITLTKQDGSTLTATFTAGGTTLPAGTGYLYNDGSNNYSYSMPELSSLLATGVPANQIPYANGSNGVNFSELKTINSTSLLGSGNFTLADVGIINTFTTNQNISAASPYLNIINTNGSSAGSGVKFWNESTQERLNIGYNNSTDEAYIYGAFNDPLKVILNGVEQSRFKTDGVFETRNLSSPPSAARSGFGGFYTYNNLPYFINSTGVATQLGSSGGGNVSNTGTPVAGQFPIWTDATTIKGTDNFKVNTNNSTYHSLEIKSPYPGLLLRDSDYDSNPAPNGRYGEIHYDGNNLILGQQAGASYYHAVFGRNNTYFYSLAADATPSNVLYFNSSTGEVTYGAKPSGGSGMVWPNNAGIPVYSGSSSWSTSIAIPNNTTTFLRGDGTFASVPGGFLDPMTTRGDIIYRNSSNVTSRLGLGLNGQVLSSNGSDLVWATPAGGGNVSNSGTPVSGQLATWNSSTTIYGANVLTTDGFGLNVTSSAGNDPQIKFIDGDVSSRNLTQYFQTNAHIFRYYDGSSSWYPLTLKYTGLTTPAIVLTDINSGSYEDINGSIVYNGTDFLGKVGGTWKSLTAGAGGGSGTVTNFSAGNLNPLFTTSVANSTTTPALSFSLSSASSYTVFGNQTAGTTTPSYGKLHVNTINATGTPSSSTFLRGDGTWSTPAGSTNYWTYSAPNLYPNNLTDNLALGTADAGAYKLKVVGNSRVEGQLSVNWTTGGSAYSVFVNSNSALAAGFFDNSSTGRGIYVRAFSNIPAVLEVTNPTIDNTIETILELRRMNNGSPGTGAGAGILFTHEIQGVTDPVKFATIASKSTDVTASSEDGSLIFSTVKDGTVSQKMSLDNDGRVVVNSSVDVGDDSASASSNNVGAIRYRVSGNNSYCEMVMQTGASTYSWVIIKQNTW